MAKRVRAYECSLCGHIERYKINMDEHEGVKPWGLIKLKPGQVFRWLHEDHPDRIDIAIIIGEAALLTSHLIGYDALGYRIYQEPLYARTIRSFETPAGVIRRRIRMNRSLTELSKEQHGICTDALNTPIIDQNGYIIQPSKTHIEHISESYSKLKLLRGTIDDLFETERVVDEFYDCMAHTK